MLLKPDTSEVSVQSADFDLALEYAALCTKQKTNGAAAGAVVSFVGLVRELVHDNLKSMRLEHYPGMTEKALESIVDDAKSRWKIEALRLIHRIGDIPLGGQIVLVIAAAAHRGDAFSAAEFIMNRLKTDAPFWKREEKTDGHHQWVEAKERDKPSLLKLPTTDSQNSSMSP